MRTCPSCGLALSNGAAHVPTPELVGPGDESVLFCIVSARHITIPLSWRDDLRRSVRSHWRGFPW